MGFLVAGLFFFRFWRKSRDVLFGAFSAAFILFALDQLALALQAGASVGGISFLFRLAGFALLIIAIFRKNMR